MPTRVGKVLSWASTLEPQTLEQATTTASMPFVVQPLALMPDAHLGKGSTVGSVIATEGPIISAAVGVDIGCGMAAVQTRGSRAMTCPTTWAGCTIASGPRSRLESGRDTRTAQDYAYANRALMLDNVLRELRAFLGLDTHPKVDRINCHHNFTQQERHRGRNLWTTRKGAIQARAGQRGIIPGSMGTRSYIVEGLGSAASYESCSHGAGRRMSRSAAVRSLSVQSLREAMGGKTWNASDAADLVDEHPAATRTSTR